jgi:hypothetical protein
MAWRANVVDDFPTMSVRLHLADITLDRSDYVVQIGPDRETQLRTVREGLVGPAGMALPREAAEALRDALNAFFGEKPNDYRARYEEARDALEHERRRVDAALRIPVLPENET